MPAAPVSAVLAVARDHPAYEGHFPGQPILPGVVILAVAGLGDRQFVHQLTFEVSGRVLRIGRRVAFAEAHARNRDGDLVGHATSSIAVLGGDGS